MHSQDNMTFLFLHRVFKKEGSSVAVILQRWIWHLSPWHLALWLLELPSMANKHVLLSILFVKGRHLIAQFQIIAHAAEPPNQLINAFSANFEAAA